jgi:uncharacterized Zn finger protein (UPF0148 family)
MPWSLAEQLEFVIWALNAGPLFAMHGPADENEWLLLERLQRETAPRLRYFVEIWDCSGRNLERMWQEHYLECLFIDKFFAKRPIQLLWGDQDRAGFIHTFLDDHGSTPDEEAARFFLTLIWNSENEKLRGPCAGCGRYYIRRTAGNTTYCSRSCGTRATAIAATMRKRASEHEDKLRRARAAIEEFARQQHKAKHERKRRTNTEWKEWVSTLEPEITRNFLTRAVNKGELKPPQRN